MISIELTEVMTQVEITMKDVRRDNNRITRRSRFSQLKWFPIVFVCRNIFHRHNRWPPIKKSFQGNFAIFAINLWILCKFCENFDIFGDL